MLTLYGIPNCDTCRKARKWLAQKSVTHNFHDLRVDGLDIETLKRWTDRTDWRGLLNTRSRTWRNVPRIARETVSISSALSLMLEQPTLIKRPLLESTDFIMIGFLPEQYAELLGSGFSQVVPDTEHPDR